MFKKIVRFFCLDFKKTSSTASFIPPEEFLFLLKSHLVSGWIHGDHLRLHREAE